MFSMITQNFVNFKMHLEHYMLIVVSLNLSPQSSGSTTEEEAEKYRSQRAWKTPGRHGSQNQHEESSYELPEVKQHP